MCVCACVYIYIYIYTVYIYVRAHSARRPPCLPRLSFSVSASVSVFLVCAVLFLFWPLSGLACSTLCYFLDAVLKPMGRYVRGPACQAVLVHAKAASLGL